MLRQGILELVKIGGVAKAAAVDWKRKICALKLCVDLKVHINGKTFEENYTFSDMESILHNLHDASDFAKMTFQTHINKSNWTSTQKKNV